MNSVRPYNNVGVDDFAVVQSYCSIFRIASHNFAAKKDLHRGPAFTITNCKACKFVVKIASVTHHILSDFNHLHPIN
jgi:hypothetical protein